MSMTASLQANLPGFLRSAALPDIALVLEAAAVELRARAMPGTVELAHAAHVLRLYVSAFISAGVPIFSGDCAPATCICLAGPLGARVRGWHRLDCPAK
ncbi:MAG: hypothetical protein Q8R92_03065 [Deltaproteobacteria bacterium]|nr:hypothetical protein [Deltaproteobacteria bacterium]